MSAIFYPDGHPKADQGKATLDAEESFYDKGLRFGNVVIGDGKHNDDGGDEGQDVGGDDDGAPSDQVVGGPVLAIVLVGDAKAKHDPANDQLEETLTAGGL